ncbi:Mg(2+) transporter [Orbilia blumenaviensis]|uniref:Mg(2+) transporter n=1 Tax=Orbilia blumenaviensis TaxID=1796055 RepID=A0AAV9UMC8_9PEZI
MPNENINVWHTFLNKLKDLGSHTPGLEEFYDDVYSRYKEAISQNITSGIDVHALNIHKAEGSGNSPQYHLKKSLPRPEPKDIANFIRNPEKDIKLRIIVFQHGEKYNPEILADFAHFYNIDLRLLAEHFLPFSDKFHHPKLSRVPYTQRARRWEYLNYLPSEGDNSAISLIGSNCKRTSLLIPQGHGLGYKVVIVFIGRHDGKSRLEGRRTPPQSIEKGCNFRAINRDTLRFGSQAPSDLGDLPERPGAYDVDTCFFRLSKLTDLQLGLAVSQPIIITEPFLRINFIESLAEIGSVQESIGQLRDWLQRRYDKETPRELVDRLSKLDDEHKLFDPNTFGSVNDKIAIMADSVRDHLMHPHSPWINSDVASQDARYAKELATRIAMDVGRMEERASQLRHIIENYQSFLRATESVQEARKSVEQAESVKLLTKVAFIYIPLTFAASLFGINIREWQGSELPSVIWFIVTAVLCIIITSLVAFIVSKWSKDGWSWKWRVWIGSCIYGRGKYQDGSIV